MKEIQIRKYGEKDIPAMVKIWNEVVEDGIAFPQLEVLTEESGREFFAQQTYCGVAEDEAGEVLGLYILHPNNVGRCGHICNASYAVSREKEDCTSGRSWSGTASDRHMKRASVFCSLMLLWLPMSMQDIYMKELDSISWESFREAFC